MTTPLDLLLAEREYTTPSKGSTLMFDLYALYHLAYSQGGLKASYGHTPNTTNHGRMTLIDRSFEECLHKTAAILNEDVARALYEELENFIDETLIPTDEMLAWAAGRANVLKVVMRDINGKPTKDKSYLEAGVASLPPWSEIGYATAIEIFSCPLWVEHADMYGGPLWAKIAEAAKGLHDALQRSAEPQKLIFLIDRIYDFEHNTGSLAEKLPARSRVARADLDKRASARSDADFIPVVSDYVRRLFRAPRPI